jgi:UDP-N-acetylmuramate: L-alanyl-gamma-D-glutamyl-meso-diaminopimelate ligase
MVRISDAPIMVIEGDEYLSSPIDRKPKFLHYKSNLLLITGIAWDHINVFPTFDNYLKQFRELLKDTPKDASVFWYEEDEHLRRLSEEFASLFNEMKSYGSLEGTNESNGTKVDFEGESYDLSIFGEHNLANCYGAMKVCSRLGISERDFLLSMRDFKGAALRMEKLLDAPDRSIYRDFAHAPSKVRASIKALSFRNPDRRSIAVLELHTFSSLNKEFMAEYKASLDPADQAIVFYSPKTIEHKKLEPIFPKDVKEAFGKDDLLVITESKALEQALMNLDMKMADLILMSSGNFGGIKIPELVEHLKSN